MLRGRARRWTRMLADRMANGHRFRCQPPCRTGWRRCSARIGGELLQAALAGLPMPWRYLERFPFQPPHQFGSDIGWCDRAFLPDTVDIARQCASECGIGRDQPAFQPSFRIQPVCTAGRIDPGANLGQQLEKPDVILKYNRSSVHISLLRIATNQARASSAHGQSKRIEAACGVRLSPASWV